VSPAVAIDLDAVLGDTHGLWQAFLEDAARRFASIAPLDIAALPADRVAAAEALDRWAQAGVGDWRGALERFAEDCGPVHLRPDAEAGRRLRSLVAAGYRLGVFTDAPLELAETAVAHLGLRRRLEVIEAGPDALTRAVERLGGPDTRIARSFDDLATILVGGT
jgi:phosphoglycolate phosphatase-like HAD superfamily hydrolase